MKSNCGLCGREHFARPYNVCQDCDQRIREKELARAEAIEAERLKRTSS